MDRISDSGSDDWGSTPHGRTKKRTAVIAARFFVAEKSIESTLCCARAPGYGKVSSLCDDNLFS